LTGDTSWHALRREWKWGAEDFRDFLASQLGRWGRAHESPRARDETDAARAERIVQEELTVAGWKKDDLDRAAKGHWLKVRIAERLRRETPVTRQWIATRLRMGSASYLSWLFWRATRRESPGRLKGSSAHQNPEAPLVD
jgi:hypothetical protein